MSLRRWFRRSFLALLLVSAVVPVASLSSASPSCHYYEDSEPGWVQGHGAVCMGTGSGCQECYGDGTTCVDSGGEEAPCLEYRY